MINRIVILALILLCIVGVQHQACAQKKTPKYLLRPYVVSEGKNLFIVKIDYFRTRTPDDDWEDVWFEFRRNGNELVDWAEKQYNEKYRTFKVGLNDTTIPRIHKFSDNDIIYKVTSINKRYPIEITDKIKKALDDHTEFESIDGDQSDFFKGYLTLDQLFGFIFDVDEGRTLEEVTSTYDGTSDRFKEHFDNMINDFGNSSSQYLEIVGSASPDYMGTQSIADSENIKLAGLRTAEGVNFFITEYNKKFDPDLAATASYDDVTNTISLEGIGTERIVAKNGEVTDLDDGANDFINDRAVWFRLKMY